MGDERQAQAASMGGDEQIVGSNDLSRSLQLRTNLRIMSRRVVGEIQNFYVI